MSQQLVTRESLIELLSHPNPRFVERVIGRAVVGLFKNQTAEEQNSNSTKQNNSVGFSGADAYSGSLTAKYFMCHGDLQDWQIQKWLKPNCKGVPRIAKYWKQLNEIANKKDNHNVKH